MGDIVIEPMDLPKLPSQACRTPCSEPMPPGMAGIMVEIGPYTPIINPF